MTASQYRSGVPDNWFVDPVNLGVPGVRRPVEADEGILHFSGEGTVFVAVPGH